MSISWISDHIVNIQWTSCLNMILIYSHEHIVNIWSYREYPVNIMFKSSEYKKKIPPRSGYLNILTGYWQDIHRFKRDINEIFTYLNVILTLSPEIVLYRLNTLISVYIFLQDTHKCISLRKILTWAYLAHICEYRMYQLQTASIRRPWPPAGPPHPYRDRYWSETH
jgi:hypothetical protein